MAKPPTPEPELRPFRLAAGSDHLGPLGQRLAQLDPPVLTYPQGQIKAVEDFISYRGRTLRRRVLTGASAAIAGILIGHIGQSYADLWYWIMVAAIAFLGAMIALVVGPVRPHWDCDRDGEYVPQPLREERLRIGQVLAENGIRDVTFSGHSLLVRLRFIRRPEPDLAALDVCSLDGSERYTVAVWRPS